MLEANETLTDGELEDLRLLVEDPVDYAELLLGIDLWDGQKRILRSAVANPQTIVKACHSSGKTVCGAIAVLHFLASEPSGVVLTTAPTLRQVKHLLWGEIRRAARQGRIAFPRIHTTQIKIGESRGADADGAPARDDIYALGLTATEDVKFQGFHAPAALIVLDEMPGIRHEIWEAIEGIRASGRVHILGLGNPTESGGPFYDAFTRARARWSTFSISAFDTPNLASIKIRQPKKEELERFPDQAWGPGHPLREELVLEALREMRERDPGEFEADPFPYLARRGWVLDCFESWGPSHPRYQSRVRGNFPVGKGDLFALAKLEAARLPVNAPRPPGQKRRICGGLDVAGGGRNETVLWLRDEHRLLEMHVFTEADPQGAIVAVLAPLKRSGELWCVAVDKVGIGHNTYYRLAELGFPMWGVNVGEAAGNSDDYVNLRAELLWDLRERFELGEVSGLTDDETIAQLSQHRFRYTGAGKIEVESKEKMADRGIESPDRADALYLCFGVDKLRPRIY